MMDGNLSVGENGGDVIPGQRYGETLNGGSGPTGLACVPDPRCDVHLRTHHVCRLVCTKGGGAILHTGPRLGGDRKG
jgi:hypothetical protein